MTNNTYALEGSDGTNIVFDDVQYSILADSLEGLSTYPAEYEISQTPGVVGGRVINTVIGERELSLHVVIYGTGRAQLETRRRTLIKALNPLLGTCKFVWNQENGDTYYLLCRPTEDSPAFETGTTNNATTWDCTVTLTCADPCWHSSDESVATLLSTETGFQVPFQVPFSFGNLSPSATVTNNGTAPAPITVRMMGALTAPIVLTNSTTGESITVKKNVLADDVLTINTDRNDLTVTYYDHTTQTTSNALSYCTVGSKFWQLAVGANSISLSAYDVDDGSAILTFRERMVAL